MTVRNGLIYPEPWDETRCRVCGFPAHPQHCTPELCVIRPEQPLKGRADALRPITDTDRLAWGFCFPSEVFRIFRDNVNESDYRAAIDRAMEHESEC